MINFHRFLKKNMFSTVLFTVLCACVGYALATSANMPWETPLNTLVNSLKGTTAKAIALIGLFVAGGLMVFGGELSDFSRRITWMVLALSVMLAGAGLLDTLFSGKGTALVYSIEHAAKFFV